MRIVSSRWGAVRRDIEQDESVHDGVDERHWLPGKGIIDFKLIILGLQAKGYKGPWMFESAGTAAEKVADWSRLEALATAR
jgi:sugar phosphate isomerase/epimerase